MKCIVIKDFEREGYLITALFEPKTDELGNKYYLFFGELTPMLTDKVSNYEEIEISKSMNYNYRSKKIIVDGKETGEKRPLWYIYPSVCPCCGSAKYE